MTSRPACLVARTLLLSCCALLVDTAVRRPDVILIVMDTTRADRCSFLGYARPTTPRLEELARDAVAFSDAWSPAGWTPPAHASLFTGLRPENHGCNGETRQNLDEGFTTLAEFLRDAGWTTACFSNNWYVSPEWGLTQGFHYYVPPDERRPYPYAAETHRMAAEWAEEEHRAGRPFFLFINDMEPHTPYTPPEEEQDRFLRDRPSRQEVAAARAFGPPHEIRYATGLETFTQRQIDLLSDLYDAEIATLDREIGRLFDRLRTAGFLDSAIVVVTADHGEYFGEGHMLEHGRGLHRAVCRVPLLVRSRGSFDGGRSVDSVVRLEDVAPTILELAGRPIPAGLDGVSLTHNLGGRISRGFEGTNQQVVEHLKGDAPGADIRHLAAGIRTVYDGRWHLLVYTDGVVELFDVTNDPSEKTNLAKREPAIVERLVELLPH